MEHDIPVIYQPKELKVNLYKHQLASIYQMEKRESDKKIVQNGVTIDTNIGINADSTGYGKTLSMVTLVYRDKMEWDMKTPFSQSVITTFASGRIKKTVQEEYTKLDVTLVLASQSIICQWYEEFKKTPVSVKMITTKKEVDTTIIENYDAILVTPTMYNILVCKYAKLAWKRFIFDEPGHIKVPAMNKIIAGFNWLVTATPDAILARHKSCRNSFMYDLIASYCYCFSDIFNFLLVKNNDEFIKQSFLMPPTHNFYYKCYNPMYNTVKGFVTPKITQMISAGNIDGAISLLGGGNTSNIAELVKQKKLSEIEEINSRIKILTIRNKQNQVEDLQKKINVLNSQIKELDNRYTQLLAGDCNICMEPISNPIMESNCQNIFCGSCLLKWLEHKETCPLCRQHIKPEQLIYIGESKLNNFQPKVKQLETKVNTVINLIKSKKGKFIIFSEWDQTFVPIRNILASNNIDFIELKGTVKERQNSLENFKTGNINVIFLNSQFNGSGINIQEATDIIVYHEMNTSTLNQIIGRANRIGRKESLSVHHLQN
jgi:SNF2 family DNA or RNA helicase